MKAGLTRAAAATVILLAAACQGEDGVVNDAIPTLNETGAERCQFFLALNHTKAYFPFGQVRAPKALIQAMAAAGPRTADARAAGFQVLELIADLVRDGGGGPLSAGSDLTNELIECMFAPADFPAVFPADFTDELDPQGDGGFDVRRAAVDGTPVLARGPFAFSGVAPQPLTSWGDVLDEPVLIYGERTGPEAYDWSMVPRGAEFDPPVVVGICVESFGTVMLSEENVGVLAFVDPTYFLPCPNLVAGGMAPKPGPLGRLTSLALRLIGPSPLQASTLLPGGTGGLAGGLRSIFEPIDLNTAGPVRLVFVDAPTGAIVNETLPPVRVRAETPQGTAVAGVEITVDAAFPDILEGTTTLVSGPDGIVTFVDLRITRAGEAVLKSAGTVLNRPAVLVLGRRTDPFVVSAPD